MPFQLGISFFKLEKLIFHVIFMYSSKCQTLQYETIQQQTNKKSHPFFQYLHCRPQFGRVDATEQKKDEVSLPPKKPQEFLSKKKASKMLLLSWGKNEKRETKVVIQSGLRLKLSFEVFWKFFLFVLAPSPAALLLSPMREGRPRSAKKVLSPTDDSKFHWLSSLDL